MVVGGRSYRQRQIHGQPHQYLNLQYLLPWHDGDGDVCVQFGKETSLHLHRRVTMLGSRIHFVGKLPKLFSMVVGEHSYR